MTFNLLNSLFFLFPSPIHLFYFTCSSHYFSVLSYPHLALFLLFCVFTYLSFCFFLYFSCMCVALCVCGLLSLGCLVVKSLILIVVLVLWFGLDDSRAVLLCIVCLLLCYCNVAYPYMFIFIMMRLPS